MQKIPVIHTPQSPADTDQKVNLLGMSKDELGVFFENLGEKKFRATQVMKWIYQFGVTDFGEMTNLSKKLQQQLSEVACVVPPKVKFKQFSEDGTRKWVFEVAGGSLVETVLIPAETVKSMDEKPCVSHRKWDVRWTVRFVVRANRALSEI